MQKYDANVNLMLINNTFLYSRRRKKDLYRWFNLLQRKRKSGSHTFCTAYIDGLLVCFDDMFHDG